MIISRDIIRLGRSAQIYYAFLQGRLNLSQAGAINLARINEYEKP